MTRTISLKTSLLILPLTLVVTPGGAQTTTFVDVTTTVGLVPSHELDFTCPLPPIGSGSAWADFDNDRDIDLYVTNHGGPSHLYRNDGDTNADGLPDFTDVAAILGVDEASWSSHGVVFVDYDNDGDQDLYITHWGGNTLFKNTLLESGLVGFQDVTAEAGVGDADRAITAAWGDYDQDGWLDLYLAKHFDCMPNTRETVDRLFHNNGSGAFTDVTGYLCGHRAGLRADSCTQIKESHGSTATWFDYDNDADLDLYLVSDVAALGYSSVLWRNDGSDGAGGWRFTDVSAESQTDYSINSFGLSAGDYDNDGWMDIAFSHHYGGFLLRNQGDGTFEDVSNDAGVRRTHTPNGDVAVDWGTVFFDHDNDGWLDLFYVAGMISSTPTPQPDAFFLNNHDGTFTDISQESGLNDDRRGRSASIADFDQDGYVDLFVGNYGQPPVLYHNESGMQGNTNHWLTVTVEGSWSNRDGIGSRLYLTTPDGLTQIREITSGPTHGGGDYKAAYFGMGANTTGTLTVRWPNGEIRNYGTVDADQHLHIVDFIESASENKPIAGEFKLSQNYPNPFNPTTDFGFRISDFGFVSLNIYDLLGREVATLVNEVKSPGKYTVQWDAEGQASGVYVYRLKAGDFVQSHKMILSR